jgi:ferredoxin
LIAVDAKGPAMRIVIDHNKCTGLGMCEAEAPDLFEVQEDGSLLVLIERPSADQRAELEAAVESCPTEALSIVED